MSRLLIFNPEHDYALADAHRHYFPPAGILRLGRRFQYITALSALEGDLCVLSGEVYDAYTLLPVSRDKALKTVEEICPWGWDHAIKSSLQKLGFSPSLMPTDKELDCIRSISHRSISIVCNRYLGSPYIPLQHFSLNEALAYHDAHPECCFKAPWSSSGRGVMFCKDLALHAVSEWLHGVIKKQGSVMSETVADRALDFASLWTISDSKVSFRGYSVSTTDPRGRYRGNLYGKQESLVSHIKSALPEFDEIIIERQKKFLSEKVAPYYNGRIGIDMIADTAGQVRPCIEINLRNTMGHVAMDLQEALDNGGKDRIQRILPFIPPIFIPA